MTLIEGTILKISYKGKKLPLAAFMAIEIGIFISFYFSLFCPLVVAKLVKVCSCSIRRRRRRSRIRSIEVEVGMVFVAVVELWTLSECRR